MDSYGGLSDPVTRPSNTVGQLLNFNILVCKQDVKP